MGGVRKKLLRIRSGSED